MKKPISPTRAAVILVIAVLLIASLTSLVLRSQKPSPPIAKPPIVTQPLVLSLQSPAEETVVLDEQVTVKGKTLPNTPVVFYTETDQNSTESDATGQFEGKIVLAAGINTLTVSAFGQNGEEKTVALDLVYDDQVKGVKTKSDEPPGQSKKEEKGQKATIGGVQQVTTSSVVVEEKKLKKKTEAIVDQNTQIVGQEKKTLKLNAIKPKDLVAIISTESAVATPPGFLKKALKIFVKPATPSAQLKRRAVYGVITGISGQIITLAHPTQRERVYSLLANEQTVIKIKGVVDATFADLAVGQRIAAVGDLNESGVLVAKRIHIIPGKATGIFERYPVATPTAILTITPTTTPSASPTLTPTETPPSPTP